MERLVKDIQDIGFSPGYSVILADFRSIRKMFEPEVEEVQKPKRKKYSGY
ncbi:MAG: hypothetical protein AAB472_00250 [Patescibacteria group bacterium]